MGKRQSKTSLDQWLRTNEDYMANAMAGLQLHFEQLLEDEKGSTARQARFDKVVAMMAEAEKRSSPPALAILCRRLGFSEFEKWVLLLCIGMELDTRITALCAKAQLQAARPYPTFALAFSLFNRPAWEALSPERPLRYWRLIEISQPGAQPLTTSALRADERIVSYVKGLNYVDDRLTPWLAPLGEDVALESLPPSQGQVAERIVQYLQNQSHASQVPVVNLTGTDPISKRLVASAVASELGVHPYRLPADLLPTQTSELETLLRLWERETLMLPVALYVDASDIDRSPTVVTLINRFLMRTTGLVFLDTRENWGGNGRHIVPFEVSKPSTDEQQVLWTAVLGEEHRGIAAQLANQFDMNTSLIWQTAEMASATASLKESNEKASRRLWSACVSRMRPRLDGLARQLEPKATWDDLVLPSSELRLLHNIAVQVRHRTRVYDDWGFRRRMNRGLGISALFAGESGTGKTMAAEVIAGDLDLSLYRIDLSSVVSKYIGETAKNLQQVFDAAEGGGAILFFDEADALFGKRSEVKDSHDRYANIEINYLLQRMEAYRGVAILATNMKNALDRAFMRRLRFIVTFPFPGAAERKAIWQRAFPPETPMGEVEWDHLARLAVTGGSIHNIALGASFLAARDGEEVTMARIVEAAREEFVKLDRPINELDFAWQESNGLMEGSAHERSSAHRTIGAR